MQKQRMIASETGAAMNGAATAALPYQQALCYTNLFWLFLFGNVLGVLMEGIWSVGVLGHWETHVTMIWGPFNIVYGIGAVGMYVAAVCLKERPLIVNFLVLAAVSSTVEYLVAVFQERVFHSVSWNYSNHWMNLNGKISLPITLMWGVLGVLFSKLLLPPLTKLLPKLRGKNWNRVCVIFSVFLAVDMLVSLVLLFRWGQGWTGASDRALLRFFDAHYPAETLQNRFVEWTLLD